MCVPEYIVSSNQNKKLKGKTAKKNSDRNIPQNICSLGPSSPLSLPTNSLLNPNPNLLEPYHDGCCAQDPSSEDEVLSWNENVEDISDSEPEEESESEPGSEKVSDGADENK